MTLLLLFVWLPLLAAESDGGEINTKEIVLEHLGDSYEWHITTVGEHHVTIPLLVIVRSESGSWHCFSSSRLHDGATWEGFTLAHDGDYAGKVVEVHPDGSVTRPFDMSITKTVAALLINSALLIVLVVCATRAYRHRKVDSDAPRGLAGLFEMLVSYLLDDLIKPCAGPGYRRFAPYLLTVFFFILINNLMGLIPFFPGGANVSGNIAVTFILALATFLAVNLFGSRHYWKDIFWPDLPMMLKAPIPIIPVIELVGIFTKPFALMIRLFANMMAGHAVILSLTCVIFVTVKMGPAINASMTVVSVAFSIFMNCLELLVAFLQAYVFTMLSAVFIGLAQEGKHEPEQEIEK